MNYYSDYEEEPKDGNSESKWEPTADMNIIKSVMSAVTAIMPQKEDIGRILHANYKKLGDGVNMSARMEISTNLWTIVWENTDSEVSKSCSFVFSPTEERKETEKLLTFATRTEELEKLFCQEEEI